MEPERKKMKKTLPVMVITLMAILLNACNPTNTGLNNTPMEDGKDETSTKMLQKPMDQTYIKKDGIEVIYLAGGCFWGIEKLMQSIPGVVDVVSGYANGKADLVPTYNKVLTGNTGYRETVRVEYDPSEVSLDAILFTYFNIIDPTIENRQGNDRGTQYQTGVYYVDEVSQSIVERIAAIERARTSKFVVEIEPLTIFYDAEEYHQDYLDKNPMGYCHISPDEMRAASQLIIDPADYPRPSDEEIKARLTDLQYNVTQNDGTERAFNNEYWDNQEEGIYVDVVTGEPLFSSREKFTSGTGWPSFSAPIDEHTIRFIEDKSFGMRRIEVRSRAGNSHLGHVFYDDPTSPNGTRYCINSAALRFISLAAMEEEGYGYLLSLVHP
jgi:peptide methionine sulfoxide reductase msrA/msrB